MVINNIGSMNRFEGLHLEEDRDDEIQTPNQLRNRKKKKKRKEEQLKNKYSEKLEAEIHRLEVQIREYEGRNKGAIPKSQEKKKEEKGQKEMDDFDENEIREYNRKRQEELDKERKRENEKRRREEERNRKRREEHEKENNRRREEWGKENNRRREEWEKENNRRREERENHIRYWNLRETLITQVNKNDIPDDIRGLFNNYNSRKWKVLMLKYHPDKINTSSKYNEEYSCLLNNIKDYHTYNNENSILE